MSPGNDRGCVPAWSWCENHFSHLAVLLRESLLAPPREPPTPPTPHPRRRPGPALREQWCHGQLLGCPCDSCVPWPASRLPVRIAGPHGLHPTARRAPRASACFAAALPTTGLKNPSPAKTAGPAGPPLRDGTQPRTSRMPPPPVAAKVERVCLFFAEDRAPNPDPSASGLPEP